MEKFDQMIGMMRRMYEEADADTREGIFHCVALAAGLASEGPEIARAVAARLAEATEAVEKTKRKLDCERN